MIGILVSGGVSGGHLNPGLKFVLPETNAEKISRLRKSRKMLRPLINVNIDTFF